MNAPASSRHYVFGPVPSRRLGRSPGVDLVPLKVCSYDCIYCQLGRTTKKTVERKEWVPTNAVLDELKRKLATRPDYITFSGSGEPTLHSGLGEIIEHIQAMTKTPVAVLTNGSLLWQPEVRAELALADVVMPSLDAGDDLLFQAVNRPHTEITFEKLVAGLEQFRRALDYLVHHGIEMFAGKPGAPVELLIPACLEGRLPQMRAGCDEQHESDATAHDCRLAAYFERLTDGD